MSRKENHQNITSPTQENVVKDTYVPTATQVDVLLDGNVIGSAPSPVQAIGGSLVWNAAPVPTGDTVYLNGQSGDSVVISFLPPAALHHITLDTNSWTVTVEHRVEHPVYDDKLVFPIFGYEEGVTIVGYND